MSTNVKIVAALLGCLAVVFLWLGRESDEPPAPQGDQASASAFERPKRRMLLEQPPARGGIDNEARAPRIRSQLDARSKKVEERRLARQQRAMASDSEDDEDFDHWRDVILNDPDPDERADALTQMDYEEPEAMGVLIQALQDRDAEVRLAALDELWVTVDEPPLDVLAPVLSDPDPEVRAEAVRMIAESDEARAAELLAAALADPDEDVRDEAADALDLDLDEDEI